MDGAGDRTNPFSDAARPVPLISAFSRRCPVVGKKCGTHTKGNDFIWLLMTRFDSCGVSVNPPDMRTLFAVAHANRSRQTTESPSAPFLWLMRMTTPTACPSVHAL